MDPSFCYLCFKFVFTIHVLYSLLITYWERADLLAMMCVIFSCDGVFVTFPYGVLGQVWYLIVSIPDLCLLTFISVNRFILYAIPNPYKLEESISN